MLWPLLISTSTVKVLKYYVVLEYSSTLYLYRSRDPFPDRTLSRTAYTYYSCSRYLPYSFKKFLCVPGSQQENVPEHQNEPPLNMVSSKSELTSLVESTGSGDQTQIFGPQGGLDGGSEGSGRVGLQAVF